MASCVSRPCVIVLRIQVFMRRREENDLSVEAAEIGKHKMRLTNFSTSEKMDSVTGSTEAITAAAPVAHLEGSFRIVHKS